MKKKRIILLLACALLIYIFWFFYHTVNESAKTPIKYETKVNTNYLKLFNSNVQRKLTFQSGVSFKSRNSIYSFIYDQKYNLEITKINVVTNINLKYALVEAYQNVEGSYPNEIIPIDEKDFVINYYDKQDTPASSIQLSLFGDSIKTILKNDSLACYYLKCKNVYVQYNKNDIYNIFLEAKARLIFTRKKPVSLLFLKKDNSVYFILFTSIVNSLKLDPYLLNSLLK